MVPKDRNKKGTGFTNIGRILEASRGARLGGQVASGVQQTGQQVRSQIGQAAGQFQEQAKKDAERFGQQAASERDSLISQVGSGAEGLNQGDLQQKFTDYRSGEYKGPRELEDYGTLSGRVSEAEQVGRLGRTTGGRQELLKRFVGGRDYTQGAQALDTALLGLTGQKELADARRATRGLSGDLAQQTGIATSTAAGLEKAADQFRKDTLARLSEARNPITEDIRIRTQEASALEDKRKKEYENILAELAKPPMERTIAESSYMPSAPGTLGVSQRALPMPALQMIIDSPYIDQDQKNNLMSLASNANRRGLNVEQLLMQALTEDSAKNISQSSLATESERQRLRILDQLAGRSGTDVGIQGSQDPYQQGRINLQLDALRKAVGDANASAIQDLSDQIGGSLDLGTIANTGVDMVKDEVLNDPAGFFGDALGQMGTDAWKFATSPVNTAIDLVKNPEETAKDLIGRLPNELRNPGETLTDLVGRLPKLPTIPLPAPIPPIKLSTPKITIKKPKIKW